MNSDYNVTAIIRAAFNEENILFLLDRGLKIGLKYRTTNGAISSYENIIEHVISKTKNPHNLTRIEITTMFETFCFSFILEDGYSTKASEAGLACNFTNIIIQELSSSNTKQDKSKIIELMLNLIKEYFIYELHAQEGQYQPEEDI